MLRRCHILVSLRTLHNAPFRDSCSAASPAVARIRQVSAYSVSERSLCLLALTNLASERTLTSTGGGRVFASIRSFCYTPIPTAHRFPQQTCLSHSYPLECLYALLRTFGGGEMDEKTLAIMNELAARLGTTAEYLWGVLITQAPISGVMDILGIALLGGCFWGWFKLVYRKVSEGDWRDEMGVFFAWFSVFICGMIFVLIFATNLSLIAAAFVNPEYWALKQIIH